MDDENVKNENLGEDHDKNETVILISSELLNNFKILDCAYCKKITHRNLYVEIFTIINQYDIKTCSIAYTCRLPQSKELRLTVVHPQIDVGCATFSISSI